MISLYYFLTPIWFCRIQRDENVCPSISGKPYAGWLSALYFASVTLSTVGYDDLSVEGDTSWSLLQGTLYIILSNVTLIFAFGEVAASTFTPLKAFQQRLNDWILGKPNDGELLWKKIHRLEFAFSLELVGQFLLLNAIGVFATQIYEITTEAPEEQWSWMKSVYWAVQTTTTVGYGDVAMGIELRWFQIMYLIMSTYFVGNAISGLASLKDQLDDVCRHFAWSRRGVSKAMVVDMQGDRDDYIDQYEFAMASLLALGKVTSEDTRPIMDKCREVANDSGFIVISETCTEPTESQVLALEDGGANDASTLRHHFVLQSLWGWSLPFRIKNNQPTMDTHMHHIMCQAN